MPTRSRFTVRWKLMEEAGPLCGVTRLLITSILKPEQTQSSPDLTGELAEHDYNAFEFSLWKRFGTEIFIKSNINNWLVCSPNGGSFVDWRRGSVDCKIVNHITDAECQDGSPPTRFQPGMPLCGPFFDRGHWAFYYYFDGCPGNGFPAHDPCGQTQDNGLKNVKNPHGNVFVR